MLSPVLLFILWKFVLYRFRINARRDQLCPSDEAILSSSVLLCSASARECVVKRRAQPEVISGQEELRVRRRIPNLLNFFGPRRPNAPLFFSWKFPSKPNPTRGRRSFPVCLTGNRQQNASAIRWRFFVGL